MSSATGPPATWRGEAWLTSLPSVSQTLKSVTLVAFVASARFGSVESTQKSKASAGLSFTTFCSRVASLVSFPSLRRALFARFFLGVGEPLVHGEERLEGERRRGEERRREPPEHVI